MYNWFTPNLQPICNQFILIHAYLHITIPFKNSVNKPILIHLVIYHNHDNINGAYNPQNVYNMTPDPIQYEIADWALAGGKLSTVGNSLFYFNPYSNACPTYFPSKVGILYTRIGEHCFYAPTNAYADT